MTDEEIQNELLRVIERAKLQVPHERFTSCHQLGAAHAAVGALERAIRYDVRARNAPGEAGLKTQTKQALRDALTFALAAYILELEEATP